MIGILMNDLISSEGHDISYIYNDVANSIIKYGGKVFPIYLNDYESAIKLIDMCDGVILQGGDSFNDKHLRIVNYLYDENIPTLGICLGMQMMGVLFNGKLGDISNHKSNLNYVHEVNIDKKSKLYKIIKEDKIVVNSRHNNYLINTDLDIVGMSDVIEAIESKNRTFFMGLEWHPESMIAYDRVANIIFEYFIEGCIYGFK